MRIALQPIIGIRRIAPPAADEPTSDPLLLPAYIPARTFALALMDILNQAKASGPGIMPSISETLRNSTSTGNAFTAIDALALRAGDDPQIFQGYLEDWYNDAMDRVSGWYKKHVQNILLVIAVLLSVTFNVDSIRMGRMLWIEPTLRQTLSAAADVFVQHPPASAMPTGDPGKDLNATVAAFNQVSGNLNLPSRLAPNTPRLLEHPQPSHLASSTRPPAVPRRLDHHRRRPLLRSPVLVRYPEPLYDRPRHHQATRKKRHRPTQRLITPKSLYLAFAFAVILSAAKNPDDAHPDTSVRTFLPVISSRPAPHSTRKNSPKARQAPSTNTVS